VLEGVGRPVDHQLEDAQQRLGRVGGRMGSRRLVRGVERGQRPEPNRHQNLGRQDETHRDDAHLVAGRRRRQRRREVERAGLERQPAGRFDLAHLSLGRDPQPGRPPHGLNLLAGRLDEIDPDGGGTRGVAQDHG